MKIYIASKASHRPLWRELRDVEGFPIASQWIDTDDKFSIDAAGLDYSDLWRKCHEDVSRADVLVCYAERGEVHKGSLVEIGMALAYDVPVILCGDPQAFRDNGTWPAHPAVQHDEFAGGDIRKTLTSIVNSRAFEGVDPRCEA